MHTENETAAAEQPSPRSDLGVLLVVLLKGVIYHDSDSRRWNDLINLQNQVRDYVSVLGLELILDEAEGYAFLRARPEDASVDEEKHAKDAAIPRLIVRRQLSFPVSLLLALLRKKLAEFDASGGDTRLVLSRDNIIEMIRLFFPGSSNEARLVDQIERHINKVVDLGFLRRLKSITPSTQPDYEVRRIIKAYVDAQWLSDFDGKLDIYRQQLSDENSDNE